MNEPVQIAEKDEYLYVVNGVIPEVMPPVAYRGGGNPELVGRKLINCPHCPALLTHVELGVSVKIYRLSKGKPKKEIPGLYIKRCDACNNDVGIVMV